MEKLRSYLMIALGAALTAAAFGLIVLPQGMAAGGITGLSVLLGRALPLPVSAIVFALNAGLFLLGWAGVERILPSRPCLSVCFSLCCWSCFKAGMC